MDAVVAQIRNLAQNADEAGRLDILETLQHVQSELQGPTDFMIGLASSVCGR